MRKSYRHGPFQGFSGKTARFRMETRAPHVILSGALIRLYLERQVTPMRKLIALILTAALSLFLFCAQAEEPFVPDLTGDWSFVHVVDGQETLEMYIYLYHSGTYEMLFKEEDFSGGAEGIRGTWTFDGVTLTLRDSDHVYTLIWDPAGYQLTGNDDGVTLIMRLPVEPEDTGASGTSSVSLFGGSVYPVEEGTVYPSVDSFSYPITGGWSPASDPTVTYKINSMVLLATKGTKGVTYVPVTYLGSQVVAGYNHAVLCQKYVSVSDARPSWVILYLYEDLSGNVSITGVFPLDLGRQNP